MAPPAAPDAASTPGEPRRRATDPAPDPSAGTDPVSRRSASGATHTGEARARVVERLRHDEERFRRLAERARDVIFTLRSEPAVRFEFVSPSVEEVTGYAPDDLYADPAPGLDLLVPEAGPLPWDPDRPAGPGPVVQVAARHRDGSRIWVESRTVVVDDPVDGRRLEGILRDVTEAKRAEQELMADMATLELLHDVAVEVERTHDLPALLARVLEMVCTRTGWATGRIWAVTGEGHETDLQPVASWPGAPAHEAPPAPSRIALDAVAHGAPAWADHWERDLATDADDAPADTGGPTGTTDRTDTEGIAVAVPVVVHGRCQGAIELGAPGRVRDARLEATLENVGAHVGRAVERAMADENRRAQHDAHAAFIARAAHELRGSLAAVSMTAATLADYHEKLDHDAVAKIAAQLSAGEARLRTLADRLLDLSTIETGSLRLEPTEMDLRPVVEACIDALGTGTGEEGTRPVPEVTVHLRGSGAARVVADEIAVRQIVTNLLANAAIHGGPHVHVSIEVAADRVLIAVADDGPGVADDLVGRLFEPFVRGRAARGSGTGLGLPISQGLARAMGGDLTYEPGPPPAAHAYDDDSGADTRPTGFVLHLRAAPA